MGSGCAEVAVQAYVLHAWLLNQPSIYRQVFKCNTFIKGKGELVTSIVSFLGQSVQHIASGAFATVPQCGLKNSLLQCAQLSAGSPYWRQQGRSSVVTLPAGANERNRRSHGQVAQVNVAVFFLRFCFAHRNNLNASFIQCGCSLTPCFTFSCTLLMHHNVQLVYTLPLQLQHRS